MAKIKFSMIVKCVCVKCGSIFHIPSVLKRQMGKNVECDFCWSKGFVKNRALQGTSGRVSA